MRTQRYWNLHRDTSYNTYWNQKISIATWNFGSYLGNNKFPGPLLSNNEDYDLIFAVSCDWWLSCFPERDKDGWIGSCFTVENSTTVIGVDDQSKICCNPIFGFGLDFSEKRNCLRAQRYSIKRLWIFHNYLLHNKTTAENKRVAGFIDEATFC